MKLKNILSNTQAGAHIVREKATDAARNSVAATKDATKAGLSKTTSVVKTGAVKARRPDKVLVTTSKTGLSVTKAGVILTSNPWREQPISFMRTIRTDRLNRMANDENLIEDVKHCGLCKADSPEAPLYSRLADPQFCDIHIQRVRDFQGLKAQVESR